MDSVHHKDGMILVLHVNSYWGWQDPTQLSLNYYRAAYSSLGLSSNETPILVRTSTSSEPSNGFTSVSPEKLFLQNATGWPVRAHKIEVTQQCQLPSSHLHAYIHHLTYTTIICTWPKMSYLGQSESSVFSCFVIHDHWLLLSKKYLSIADIWIAITDSLFSTDYSFAKISFVVNSDAGIVSLSKVSAPYTGSALLANVALP